MITCGCGRYFTTAAEFFAHRNSAECPKNSPQTSARLLDWIVRTKKPRKRRNPAGLAPAHSGETAVTTATRKKSTKAAQPRAPKTSTKKTSAPRAFKMPKGLKADTVLEGQHNGKPWRLQVNADGLLLNGKPFSSLTAAAESLTGYTVSGPAFFGLWKPPAQRGETDSTHAAAVAPQVPEPAPEIPEAAPPAADQPVTP